MMLLDVFLEGLFEMDLRRVNSEEVRQLRLMLIYAAYVAHQVAVCYQQ